MFTKLESSATTETVNVSLKTLRINSMIVRCKLDVYLMSTMLENCATTETANISLHTLGTKSIHSNTVVWLSTSNLIRRFTCFVGGSGELYAGSFLLVP